MSGERDHETVWAIGTDVKVGEDPGIDGIVTGLMIEQKGVQYRVAWFDGGMRREEWLLKREVRAAGSCRVIRVGFLERGGGGESRS